MQTAEAARILFECEISALRQRPQYAAEHRSWVEKTKRGSCVAADTPGTCYSKHSNTV